MATVYRKTDKGHAEIETRAFRLLPRLRQALIVVDGHRSDVELAPLILGDPQEALEALRAGGFIEAVGGAPTAASKQPQAVSRQSPAGPGGPAIALRKAVDAFDALRRDAVRHLSDQLGPAGDGITLKLERAKTMAELRPLLVSAAYLLVGLRGGAAAQAFQARFLPDDEGA